MPKALTQAQINSVLALLNSGHTHPEIKARMPISAGSITNICARYRPDLVKAVGGRPRKLNPTETRYAVRLVTNHNSVSTRRATQALCELTGQTMHRKTVTRALKRAGLRPVKAIKKPKHTPQHILDRIAFAEAHRYWTMEDWKRVLWSDETKINRLGSDGVHWAWVRQGETLTDRQVIPTANFGGGSVMFWGCMGWSGTGFGCRLERSLNKELYLEILGDEFSRSLEYLGMEPGEVIFQQDNASSHKAKVCLKWFEDHGIEVMEWPANSPDLNPIENLWAELKRRLGEYEDPPGGILELWERVQDVWNSFGEDYCQKLIESMPRRMAMVLRRKGKAIPY
ncbi:Transposase [Ceratobasidium sp. AG-Ba]|nr:Transposase [Ceratobasidium sp. AG-Ba]QRW10903.1 Transposase [Ceratobasidium sp. AG-Ba]